MGFAYQHVKFFRIRTPAITEGYGVHLDIFWLARAIELIDFNRSILIDETIFICSVIPGAFSYRNLQTMAFDEYEIILKTAKEINRKKAHG